MTLDEAIKILVEEFSIGDYVYDVRERAGGTEGHTGSSWEHPKVLRFSEAVTVLEQHVKK